jgi:hypothetical protein
MEYVINQRMKMHKRLAAFGSFRKLILGSGALQGSLGRNDWRSSGLGFLGQPQLLLQLLLLELAQGNAELGGLGSKVGPIDGGRSRFYFFRPFCRLIVHRNLSYLFRKAGAR